VSTTPAVTARLSDLSQAADESGEVLANEALGGGMHELSVRLPRLAAAARPGQFAQLRCGPGPAPLLRRPMSVAWAEADICAFVFAPVGVGTRLLAALRPGERIDVLGPLGVGFTLPQAGGRVLCVAGGLGCAPFPLAAAVALREGASAVTVLSGAASATRLYPAARYARGDSRCAVVEATEDGSSGHPGRVTTLLEDSVVAGADAVWACGPNPMLVAVAARLERVAGLPSIVEASLEAPMGCGFGTCLGCALPIRGGEAPSWALCCRSGPVMDVARVDWTALAALPPPHVA
jgi:dihydroorotate dehydrogenase electron transfer subunit